MANNENLDYKKRSVNQILEQLNADSQFSERSFPNVPYASESFTQPRGNLYFPEQYPQTETRSTLPFVFNTREDVMPTMVGMGGGNFMVYGTPTLERNVPNNFVNKTNGMNNYHGDYSADYTLFSRGMDSSFVVPQSGEFWVSMHVFFICLYLDNNATPQLIESLVGHWGSDQSGTYSPFPSCVRNIDGQNIGEFRNDRATRK